MAGRSTRKVIPLAINTDIATAVIMPTHARAAYLIATTDTVGTRYLDSFLTRFLGKGSSNFSISTK
jgi:hypothetical protein